MKKGREALVTEDLSALGLPGVVVEVDPDVAESMGAFEETALSEDEAWEGNMDLLELGEGASALGDADGSQ